MIDTSANPFLSLGPRPLDAQAERPVDQGVMQAAAQQQAQNEAIRQAILNLLREQVAANKMGTAEVGAKGAGLGVKAGANYLRGGQVTLSSASAATKVAEPGVLSTVGKGLGYGALLYGSYEGARSGLEGSRELNRALSESRLDPEEQEALRQKHFNAQMVNMGIGGLSGAVTNPAYGWALGGAGGALGATTTYKDERHPAQATARATARFMANPFRR